MKSEAIQSLREQLETVKAYRQEETKIREEAARLARENSPQVLAKKPDPALIRRLAASQAEAAIIASAAAEADACLRELAVPVAEEAAGLYRDLRKRQAANLERARKAMRDALRRYFGPGSLDLVVEHSSVVQAANHAITSATTGNVGWDPQGRSIHPDISVERILDEVTAIERALAASNELADEIDRSR